VRTSEGLHRLTAFADAVVAIAITLLVLPLVDLDTSSHSNLGKILSDHLGQLGAFALSFVVIARLWVVHHAMFEQVVSYDGGVVQLTLAWLLTVVFLPFPTELVAGSSGRGVDALYIGTLLASSLALSGTSVWLDRHPQLTNRSSDYERDSAPWLLPGIFVVALAVELSIPSIGMWALVLLLLGDPIERLLSRRRRHRAAHESR
jgi:uncharacterized membrane protein